MRRHPRLQTLSREHMGALSLAKALQEAARWPDAQPAALDRLRTAWTAELVPHFAAEERDWLPGLTDPGLRERLTSDHAQIRALVAALLASPSPEDLASLGGLLHDHVRWEERVLFPHLEQTQLAGPSE